jgi:aarF domain-containing kinase
MHMSLYQVASRYDQIRVPAVHRDYTSRKVLTTEWVDGVQLVKAAPETIKKLVPIGVQVFLDQLLEVGFFHGDPHPGNLLVDAQNRLVLLDFGLCCEVPLPDTKTITLAVVHLMQGDVRALLDDGVALGFLQEDVEKEELYQELCKVFAKANNVTTSGQGATTSKAQFEALHRRKMKFKDISAEMNNIFFRFPLLVPDYFALIVRALIVLEGIAVTGDPDFDLFAATYPITLQKSAKFLGLRNSLIILKTAAVTR